MCGQLRKTRIAAYTLAAIAYLALVGLASYRNPILGVVLVALPAALILYLGLARRRGAKLKIPIIRLRNTYSATFYTDAPEMEVRYAISLGEELGVTAKAVLTKLPNTNTRAHKIVVYTKSISEKESKQKLTFALKSMVAMLNLKGYRVIPEKSVDESLLQEEGGEKAREVYPILAVFNDEDYGFTLAKVLELTGKTTVLVTNKTHLASSVAAAMARSPDSVGAVRFAQNFGFNMFDHPDPGLLADVAQACFNLSNESTLLIASTLSKARKEGQKLDPYSLGDMLEGETQSRGLGSKVHDELVAFQEAIRSSSVWMGLVKDHSPKIMPQILVVDLTTAGPPNVVSFIAYMLAHTILQKGGSVVLDLSSFDDRALAHALNDLRLARATAYMLPKTRLRKEHLRGFGTLIYVGADETFMSLLENFKLNRTAVEQGGSYLLTPSGSISPLVKKVSTAEVDEGKLQELIEATAKPIEVEDLSARPQLPYIFKSKEELDAIQAAFTYLEKYSMVEQTSFEQALGLRAKSSEITSKLVRLGYIKKRRKGGITFVELTARGQEELEKLRRQGSRAT